MENLKLYMLLLGCTPQGRHIEQHDVFFSIGRSLAELKPLIVDFWPEAQDKIHVDGWREVKWVDGYKITVCLRDQPGSNVTQYEKLFFINLGGYKQNEFEEFHYKMLAVGADKGMAIQKSLQTSFYLHTGFEGANSHVDDKYGVDVDDFFEIEDILPADQKEKYRIFIEPALENATDDLFLGYYKLDKL